MTRWQCCVVAAAIVVVPAGARAGGTMVVEQSAVAGGTAGAGTARDGDPSAAWYCPAALADGLGFRAGVGLMLAMPSIEARDPEGAWRASTEPSVSPPPHLHLSYAQDRWAAGLSVNVPFGGGVTWPAEWEGRFEIVSSRLEVLRLQPFLAWRLGDVRVGGGVHLDLGRLRIARDLDFIDTTGTVSIDQSGVGVGLHLSAWWQASADLALAIAFRSRSTLGLSGAADFERIPDAFAARAQDTHVDTSLPLPDDLRVGLRWRSGPLRVVGDLGLGFWTRYERLVVDFENPRTPDAVQETDWRFVASVRGGIEYDVSETVTARAGAFFDPSPVPAETLAPSSPDSTRVGGSAGASVALGERFRIDGFYTLLVLLERESESQDALAASYGGIAHFVGLGLRYRSSPGHAARRDGAGETAH